MLFICDRPLPKSGRKAAVLGTPRPVAAAFLADYARLSERLLDQFRPWSRSCSR